MILHLNPQTFHPFGTILPEKRRKSEFSGGQHFHRPLQLSQEKAPVFCAQDPCRILPQEAITILRVSLDGGKHFSCFYLDKPVHIQAGLLFSLSSFQGESTAELICTSEPALVKYLTPEDDLRTESKFRAEGIYTLFYQEKEQGFFFPGESHSMVELTYMDQGSLHSVVDGKDMLLSQGDLVFYGPDQWHMQYADIGVAPRFMTVSFDLAGPFPAQLLNRKLHASQKVVDCLHQMLREHESPDDYSGEILLALINQVLVLLLRSQEAAPVRLQPKYSVQNENNIIRQAQQYISTHVRSKLSVPHVAAMCGVSPSYLNSLFQKHLQIAPGEYIRRIRLQESKQLIRERSMNFTQIAAALSFEDPQYFSRAFKKNCGMTPTEYKNRAHV